MNDTVGASWKGWRREGRKARGALTRKDTINGLSGGFGPGSSPRSSHPAVACWFPLPSGCRSGRSDRRWAPRKGHFWSQLLHTAHLVSFSSPCSSHGYFLTPRPDEIIFQPGDNVLFSVSGLSCQTQYTLDAAFLPSLCVSDGADAI